jgi:hypothetical protein
MTIRFNPKEISQTDILIESGTYHGDFIDEHKQYYKHMHTIEIVYDLYNNATNKFKNDKHITCHHGNSPIIIKEILSKINEPVTFWLDAHQQNKKPQPFGTTAPLLEELKSIGEHHIKTHTIMIDDVRLFDIYGTTPQEIESILLAINPDYTIEYHQGYCRDDVLVARIV